MPGGGHRSGSPPGSIYFMAGTRRLRNWGRKGVKMAIFVNPRTKEVIFFLYLFFAWSKKKGPIIFFSSKKHLNLLELKAKFSEPGRIIFSSIFLYFWPDLCIAGY
jgi:hypothetical protein